MEAMPNKCKPGEKLVNGECIKVCTFKNPDNQCLKGIKHSKSKRLGEYPFMLEEPNTSTARFALGGNEQVVKTSSHSFSKSYEKTGITIDYKVEHTRIGSGDAGRIIISPEHFHGPETPDSSNIIDKNVGDWKPAASLLWRKIDGKPTIVTVTVDPMSRKQGLGKELVTQFKNEFGAVRAHGPFSTGGAKLIEGFPGAEVTNQ
jgi:hypothetical protein